MYIRKKTLTKLLTFQKKYQRLIETKYDARKTAQESEPSKTLVFETSGIKNLDIMGEKSKFNYTSHGSKYQTGLGGCITILVTVLSFAALVFISSQYFDTSSPVITTSRELSSSAKSFNVYQKDLFSGTGVSHWNVFQIEMNKFITIQAELIKKAFIPSTNTTKVEVIKKVNYITFSQITEDQSIKDLVDKMIKNPDLRIFHCPNFKEVGNNATSVSAMTLRASVPLI